MKVRSFDLGEPVHIPRCALCRNKNVGGPYFDPANSLERLREHVACIHGGGALYLKWAQMEPRKTPRTTIRMFGG